MKLKSIDRFFVLLYALQLASLTTVSAMPKTGEAITDFSYARGLIQESHLREEDSICESAHFSIKGHKIGWCAGCKRLEVCVGLFIAVGAACVASYVPGGQGTF